MKVIRCECGTLLNEVDIVKYNCQVGEPGNWLLALGAYYKFKKQGEDTIDVLEDKDVVFYWYDSENEMVVDYFEDVSVFDYRHITIKSVITHEQYIPLKQPIT